MYSKLIKRLRECTAEMNGEKTLWHQAADAIEERQAVVDGLTAQTNMVFEKTEGRTIIKFEPKWIPVTERLPEAREVVLVCGKRGGVYTAEHNRNALRPGSFWKLNSKNHHCEPTHWMPLPEPPKDGE